MLASRLPQGELTDTLMALRRVFILIGGFSLAINLLLLVPSIYMLQTYDRVLTSRNEGTLLMLTMLLVFLLALESALEYIRSKVLNRVAALIDLKLNGRVFDVMFQQGLQSKSQAARVLGDLSLVRQFLTGRGLLAFFDAPWLPIFLLVVFLLNFWLGVFGLVSAVILIALAWYNEAATGELHTLSAKQGATVQQRATTALQNAEVIHAMGMLGAVRHSWLVQQNIHLGVLGEAADRAASIGGVVKFARTALQSGILGFGAYLVLQDQLTAGGMIAASILLGRALAPVDQAIAHWKLVINARDAYWRLADLLKRHPINPQPFDLPRPQGQVLVEQIVVSAPGAREAIIKGIGFQVEPGRMIAIVGPSASGKSTLARALVGVWPPTSGVVRLDGADIHQWDRENLGHCLGYLPQDVELLDGSIAENIARFGSIDSAAVILASQRAGVHDLILRLPQGYETRIGEGGIALSGGQRQRIALARALYGDPVLVVLDEPNSNLDDLGEAALISALRDMKKRGCTVFIVSHRANLLPETDAVMVLAEGRIQTMGPTAEVIEHFREQAKRVSTGATA